MKNTFQRKKVINNGTFIYGNILNILRYKIFFFINAKILNIANRLLKVMNFIVKFIVNWWVLNYVDEFYSELIEFIIIDEFYCALMVFIVHWWCLWWTVHYDESP